MNKIIFTAALCSLSVLGFSQKNDKVQLKKGQEIKMTMVQDQTTDLGMGTMSTRSTMVSQLKVLDDANGQYKISNKVTKLTSELDGMGQNQTFDSDKAEDRSSEAGKLLAPMLDSTTYFLINGTDGAVSSVNESGKVVEDVDFTEALMQTGVAANNDASSIANLLVILPADVKVGYSWKDSSEENGLKSQMTKTVKKIENNIAYIDLDGTKSGTTTMEMMGSQIDMILNGKITGSMTVNTKTRLTQKQEMQTDITSSMDVGGQTMNMTTKGKTTISFD